MTSETQSEYQCSEQVPLHVQSLQKLQAFILQQLNGEILQVPIVKKEVFVALLFGDGNSLVKLCCHF